MRDNNNLWHIINKGRSRSYGLSLFSCYAVKGCDNIDVEIYYMARLHRTIKKRR